MRKNYLYGYRISNNVKSYVCLLVAFSCACSITSACTSFEAEDDNNGVNPYYQETSSPKEQESNNLTDSIVIVAHWNIGHFSQGKSYNTSITAQDTDSIKVLYLDMIQKVNPDIFGICEYNPIFNTDGANTAQLLFSSFPYSYIGKKYKYNCNSIFSHLPLYNCSQYFFPRCIQTRYYSVADIVLKGNTVKFVETHLDFNQNSDGKTCRLSQMEELVDAFKSYPYVIICADFNSSVREEYEIFLDAGFSLASDSLPNFGSPSSDISRIKIDNIIVKGFEVKETIEYPHNSLSDHNLYCCILKIKE